MNGKTNGDRRCELYLTKMKLKELKGQMIKVKVCTLYICHKIIWGGIVNFIASCRKKKLLLYLLK